MNVILLKNLDFSQSNSIFIALNSQNIEAVVENQVVQYYNQVYYRVLVPKNSYIEAKKIAEEILLETRNGSGCKVTQCVECDSTNFRQIDRGLFKELFSFRKSYHCNICGCIWKA